MPRSRYHNEIIQQTPYIIVLVGVLVSTILINGSIRPLYLVVGDNARGEITLIYSEIILLGSRWSNLDLDTALFYNTIGVVSVLASTILTIISLLSSGRGRILAVAAGYVMGLSMLLLGISSVLFVSGIEKIDVSLESQTSAGYISLGGARVEPTSQVWILHLLARTYFPQAMFILLFLLSFLYHYTLSGAED